MAFLLIRKSLASWEVWIFTSLERGEKGGRFSLGMDARGGDGMAGMDGVERAKIGDGGRGGGGEGGGGGGENEFRVLVWGV